MKETAKERQVKRHLKNIWSKLNHALNLRASPTLPTPPSPTPTPTIASSILPSTITIASALTSPSPI